MAHKPHWEKIWDLLSKEQGCHRQYYDMFREGMAEAPRGALSTNEISRRVGTLHVQSRIADANDNAAPPNQHIVKVGEWPLDKEGHPVAFYRIEIKEEKH